MASIGGDGCLAVLEYGLDDAVDERELAVHGRFSHSQSEALLEGQLLLLNFAPGRASAHSFTHLELEFCDFLEAIGFVHLQGKPFPALVETWGRAELTHEPLRLSQANLLLLHDFKHLTDTLPSGVVHFFFGFHIERWLQFLCAGCARLVVRKRFGWLLHAGYNLRDLHGWQGI